MYLLAILQKDLLERLVSTETGKGDRDLSLADSFPQMAKLQGVDQAEVHFFSRHCIKKQN